MSKNVGASHNSKGLHGLYREKPYLTFTFGGSLQVTLILMPYTLYEAQIKHTPFFGGGRRKK
jgi:hypothetical protein